ncbi:MAG: hypothetical protein LBD90_08600, partial [Bifidobacteriaceae bacterium]|nr:hypothetical protein [Bifidobacteriaceae bacterium]
MTAIKPPSGRSPAQGSGIFKQNRRLIVAIAATIVSVLAVAAGVFAATSGEVGSDVRTDQRLLAILRAAGETDRSLYSELNDRTQSANTGRQAVPEVLDEAAANLAAAVADFGLAKLKLGESEADQQTKLFVEDPAARVEASRVELGTGTPVGAKLPATFDTSREALHNLALKVAPLFSNQALTETAEEFAATMGPEPALPYYPTRPEDTPPSDDARYAALDALAQDIETVSDDASNGPVILWVICGVLGIAAIALWVLLALKGAAWVPAKPEAAAPGPKGAARPDS